MRLLYVEDDTALGDAVALELRDSGFEVQMTSSVESALSALEQQQFDLLLADIRLPDGSGLDVLAKSQALDPDVPVIMLTGYPDVSTAVKAMKHGAFDYVTKPVEPEDLLIIVRRAAESRKVERRLHHLEREVQREAVHEIQGASPAIVELRERIQRVAATDVPVLILGDTGVGKEVVAESIHRLSDRRDEALVKVNCSAISEQLLESELFGHERGAFTDAKQARSGLFEMADGGTLFLDEISEMRSGLQAKLLRVVEGQPFRRVGGRREIHTDTRVIAATNRDLTESIKRGEFREDLFFRLNVFPIAVPPLRDRGRDVLLLAKHFIEARGWALHRPGVTLSPEAEEALLYYHWPGNVRELRNVIERALILADKLVITPRHLATELHADSFVRRQSNPSGVGLPTLEEVERRFIELALEHSGGNISEAARQLGIARNTLKKRL